MPRRGDNIHKRKDGRWEGRYKSGIKNNGHAKYSSVYAKTFSECKEKLRVASLSDGATSKERVNVEFAEILMNWLNTNRIRLKGATITKYENLIRTQIIPELGKISIAKINAMLINDFLNKKMNSGKVENGGKLSPSYVRTIAIVIDAAIKYATQEGFCPPLGAAIHKPSIPKKDITVLNSKDERRITDVLLHQNNTTSTGILMALQTGMRIGEICALRWCDIDFNDDLIYIKHTVSRINTNDNNRKTLSVLDVPKTKSSNRVIPISRLLKSVLIKTRETSKSDFVISDTQDFIEPRTLEYRYKSFLRKNNLTVVNFHALRHTFATRCAESGMDAKTISEILGHSSATITLNIYVHPSIDIMKKQMEKLEYSA